MFSNYHYNFISKIMETIKKVLKSISNAVIKISNWFIWSSVNHKNFSLTLKALVPFLVLLNISNKEDLETVIGIFGELLVQLGTLGSLLLTIIGFGRKMYLTLNK